MLDALSFLLHLYAFVDDFCRERGVSHPARGRKPALSCAEVVALSVFSQWRRFSSERDFYGYAQDHLRAAFPTLPDRSQFNRAARAHQPLIQQALSRLTQSLGASQGAYEALDATGVAVRNAQRRGEGWLPEYVAIGRCGRLGWYEGFALLVACSPRGEVTGFGFGSANAKEQRLADAFLAARRRLARIDSAGEPPSDALYLSDAGFEGRERHERWRKECGASVLCPPRKEDAGRAAARYDRRKHASLRQIIESVFNRLLNDFRLCRERPHDLLGFQTRLTAKIALHNFCIWLNRRHGREPLEFADLIRW